MHAQGKLIALQYGACLRWRPWRRRYRTTRTRGMYRVKVAGVASSPKHRSSTVRSSSGIVKSSLSNQTKTTNHLLVFYHTRGVKNAPHIDVVSREQIGRAHV